MIADLDIYRAAKLLIDRHGADAAIQAAMRADLMLEQGELQPDWKAALAYARAAPRCRARCRQSKLPCRGPAVRDRPVCRLHGGKGGGPKGERNGAYRTGHHTAEAKAEWRKQRALMRQLRRLIALADE